VDDLCPTVHARRWERLRLLIEEFGIHPILAVIPANEDRTLEASTPDPNFWAQMQAMESGGATVALHGYHHACTSSGESLIPLHHRTEFAGVPRELQRIWIADGLEILQSHGLRPMLWVAPRHSFDRNTLRALRKEGVGYLSDGLARIPFRRGGITWIPQQLWSPTFRSKGLWTICIHPNSTHRPSVAELREFLGRYAAQFTSFERVTAEFEAMKLNPVERAHEWMATGRLLLHRHFRQHHPAR
jgi:predicted deacetylase